MPRLLWLDRFSERLGQLVVDMTPDDAWAYAEDTFPEAADLEPEEAAEIFALEMPPQEHASTPGSGWPWW